MQVYAPTNDADSEAQDDFHDQLQSVLEAVPEHDLLKVMGDWNAKIAGQTKKGGEETSSKHPLSRRVRKDNGERFFISVL